MTHRKLSLWIVAGAMALSINAARADIIDTVTVNTSGLPSIAGSEIVFFLTDGSGTGDSLNTATLSSFGFGGGSAGAVDPSLTTPSASGDITSTVTLTETSFTNIFAQFFTAGSAISFNLDLTTNLQSGPTPDQFSMAIFDPSANPISTSDPTGDDNLLVININSSDPAVVSYSNLLTVTPAGTAATPEPRQLVFPIAVLLSLALVRRRTRSPQPLAPSPKKR